METKTLEKEFLDVIASQKRTIYKVCYMYAKDADDLSDLFQETVLNLWKSFPRYRGDSSLNTWVYRIAMNTCITFLRRSSTRPQTIPLTTDAVGILADEESRTGQLQELYRLINQLGKLERALILLWLERVADESWAIYGIPIILIAVGADRNAAANNYVRQAQRENYWLGELGDHREKHCLFAQRADLLHIDGVETPGGDSVGADHLCFVLGNRNLGGQQ